MLEGVGKAVVGLGCAHIDRCPGRVRRERGRQEQDAGIFLGLAKEENPRGMENQNPAKAGQSVEARERVCIVKRSHEVRMNC